jgi:hypothetical protein
MTRIFDGTADRVQYRGRQPLDPQATDYAKAMLAQLAWWATALRKSRAEAPYPADCCGSGDLRQRRRSRPYHR